MVVIAILMNHTQERYELNPRICDLHIICLVSYMGVVSYCNTTDDIIPLSAPLSVECTNYIIHPYIPPKMHDPILTNKDGVSSATVLRAGLQFLGICLPSWCKVPPSNLNVFLMYGGCLP